MANPVQFGLKNVHYALFNTETSTYGAWKPMPGAVSMTGDPQGDQTKFFADDVTYYVVNSNSGEEGTFEIAYLTDEMKIDLLGYERDAASGMLFEATDAIQPTVALGYEVSGNENQQRGVRYNVTFSRPSQSNNTKTDSSSVDTITLNYTAIGRDFTVGGKTRNVLKSHCDNSGETHAAFDAFFDAVRIPGQAIQTDSE